MENVYELYHYGIKGMKWGIRRYQNPDGTLTDEGRRRYAKGKSAYNYESAATRKYAKKYGTDSTKYKKSAELDKKIAEEYRRDTTVDRVAGTLFLGGTGYNTYKMSRATGRGKVNSFLRSVFDVTPESLVSVGAGAAGAALGQAAGYTVTANRLVNQYANMSAKQVADLGKMYVAAGRLNEPTLQYFGKKAIDRAVAYDTMVTANKAGAAAGAVASAVGANAPKVAGAVASSRGHELSLQQKYLRNNYINKGSVYEQQRAKEEKKRARKERSGS